MKPMKTKLLLFVLMMWLPWCAKAQDQETIYRVSLTDLPEGIEKGQISVVMIKYQDEMYGETFSMFYDQESDSYIRYDNSQILKDCSQVKVGVDMYNFLSSEVWDWTFDAQAEEQQKSISLKDYRKVRFDVEDGWNFLEKEGESLYRTVGFRVGCPDGLWKEEEHVAGSGNVVNAPEMEEYYIYAKPGVYYWQGNIKRVSDNSDLDVYHHSFTIPEAGNASIKVDFEQNSLATFKLKNVDSDLFSFHVDIYNGEDDNLYNPIWSLDTNNGIASVLMPRDKTFRWKCETAGSTSYYYPQTGSCKTDAAEVTVDADYSDYVMHHVLLKGMDTWISGRIFATFKGNGEDWDCELSCGVENQKVYLPRDNYRIDASISDIYIDNNKEYYSAFPIIQYISANQEKDLVFDVTSYHRVKVLYDGEPFEVDLSRKDIPAMEGIYGSHFLLPDGRYHVYTSDYDEEVFLEQYFDVSGADKDVVMEYNPADYTSLTVNIKNINATLLPNVLEREMYFELYQDGEEIDGMYFDLASDNHSRTWKYKKGTYTYRINSWSDSPQEYFIPMTGTLELSDQEQVLDIDLNDLCYVPIEITGDKQEVIESVNLLIGNDLDNLDYIEQPDAKVIGWPGKYKITFFTGGYATKTQEFSIGKETEKLEVTMTPAEVYPLFIDLDGMDEFTSATITVDGVGSYQIVNDYEYVGDFTPFMGVKAGTYKLTVTAPGYETHTQMIDVNEANYSEEDGGVVYEVRMKVSGTSVESIEQATKPEVSVLQNRICVKAQQECRMMVYNLNGICVASAQGKQMMTEALPSGIYIVKTASSAGVSVKKVVVGK